MRAMIDAAAAQGIDELGLSDHYVLHPRGLKYDWSMDPDDLPRYVERLQAHAAEAPAGLVVRTGVEVDWFPGHRDALAAALDPLPFDYRIGSVHEVGDVIIDGSPRAWEKLDLDQRDETHRQYWIAMRGLAESGLFDIAAHLDLAKKFAFYPRIDLTREIDDALDAIEAAGLVVELNTAGWHKPCEDAYPTLDILRGCHRRGIRVTLSADAHEPAHLLRDFDRGAERLHAAGYTELARFAGREVRMEGF